MSIYLVMFRVSKNIYSSSVNEETSFFNFSSKNQMTDRDDHSEIEYMLQLK